MSNLHTLKNASRGRQSKRRVGRGAGSGLGKTAGRGQKGAGSRSGYKRRHTYEGGQFRLFMKLPTRGFSNARFRKEFEVINLEQVERLFEEGETVSEQTLRDRGFISGKIHGVKLLAKGDLNKKVTIEVHRASKQAQEKISSSGSTLSLIA